VGGFQRLPGKRHSRYLLGHKIDQMLARFRAGEGTSWYLTDKLATVRDVTSVVGILVNHIDYGSFGNILVQTNPNADERFLFTGRDNDVKAALFFYARDTMMVHWTVCKRGSIRSCRRRY